MSKLFTCKVNILYTDIFKPQNNYDVSGSGVLAQSRPSNNGGSLFVRSASPEPGARHQAVGGGFDRAKEASCRTNVGRFKGHACAFQGSASPSDACIGLAPQQGQVPDPAAIALARTPPGSRVSHRALEIGSPHGSLRREKTAMPCTRYSAPPATRCAGCCGRESAWACPLCARFWRAFWATGCPTATFRLRMAAKE